MDMGLPIGNTRAKIYSTSVIEITFLLFAYCYFYISSIPNQKKPKNKTKTTKPPKNGKLSNDKNRRSFNKHHIFSKLRYAAQ